jgi:tRNA pseudouridine38-40 synthase
MRIKAVISYDGTSFLGFQRQNYTQNTVANTIESALRALNIDAKVAASGRTDAGVHALNQTIHFDAPDFWNDAEKLKTLLNRSCYEKGIYFKRLSFAPNDFHARFSAKKRSYFYVVKANPNVFERNYVARYEGFDTAMLRQALQCFEGTHDFEFFCKSGSEVHSYKRTIYKTNVKKIGAYTLCYFQADGFLRTQIRLMTGAAIEVAFGKADFPDIVKQLNKEHKRFNKPAKSQGLYLSNVVY